MKCSTYNPDDALKIEQMIAKTFSDSEGPTEGQVIGGLTADLLKEAEAGGLYCFVATDEDEIIGCIFFSRMTFEREINAFLLAPVAVHTDHQRKGIGQKLIRYGLDVLKADGVELVITYGDPRYYSKVGFQQVTEEVVPAPLTLQFPHGWQAQSLTGDPIEPISGVSQCVNALNKAEYW